MAYTMHSTIGQRRDQIVQICKCLGIAKLVMLGLAARGWWDYAICTGMQEIKRRIAGIEPAHRATVFVVY